MALKICDITNALEKIAPRQYQEGYDNAGLITGNAEWETKGALLCLDSTEEVIDEAIAAGFNLVIAHHPIVFGGLKKITGKNYVERAVIKAIKNDIAIYAIHTNLDNVAAGVNKKICEKLKLKNCKILLQKNNLLKKLVTFCPVANAAKVREAIFEAGAGGIGNYSECSFNTEGTGTFKGNDNTNPFVGNKNEQHHEKEIRIETIFEIMNESAILKALFSSHPYEEVAYYISPVTNAFQTVGSGMIGELENETDEKDFLNLMKTAMQTKLVRHTALLNKKIKRVAVCGGAGIFLLQEAIKQQADVFVTSDVKYHQFFDADSKILLADIGHYESEHYTSELLYETVNKIFPTFALRLSKLNTNPVNYF